MNVKDIKNLRRKLKIGQTIKIEKETFVETGKRVHVVMETEKAKVVKKYPHIVEVRPWGKQEALPRRTVTYAEIARLNF